MPLGLFALAMGGFGIGLTEFVIMGLLPEVAADFGVSESVAGHLISGYALSVAIGAIALTAAVGRFDRKRVLMSLMVLFVVGNLLSAVAPTYEVLMAGRIVAALCHGAFFGIGAVVAADLVAPGKRAGAIATMFTGLTIANVLGVPFGTLLGQQFGWRSTFWAITVIGVVALAGIAALVPSVSRSDAAVSAGLGSELRAFRSPQVWFSIAITVLGFGGMFGAFTYIAFTLTEVSGFASTTVPWLLILFGAGLFVGNYVGGKAADRALTASLVTLLAGLTVVLIVYALTAQSKTMTVVSLILMGAFGFATVPGFQMRIMNYAAQAPTMASGANIAAFNVGNALGAWLGGFAIAAGFGFVSPIWIGAAVTAAGLGVLLIATRVDRGAGVAGEERVPVAA
ncbi:DHA1 family inner membrane transport protein [Rhodococcus sp. PvR044]|uniref:MFS transporter n=1 Tax=unclassified Rhodococcus (in: high G+C Gram-positive bacteria) TaxID=192944 RepID=UPI001AE6EE9E|nr:MFS transporter [Rhodococcus sp. PvR099]MBP1159885.1 DHA1 family inner membrane transport protein [Rhodococcus sp. PvR099]